MSSGSGASAGRSQPSASAWAARGELLDLARGWRRRRAGGEPEQVRRDRRRRPLDVVGASRARSRISASSTSVSTSSTSHSSSIQSCRFTDPTFANERPRPQPSERARIRPSSSVARAGRAGRPTCRRRGASSPTAATAARSSGCQQPVQRQPVRVLGSATPRRAPPASSTPAQLAPPSASTRNAPSCPAAAATSRRNVAGGDRAACRRRARTSRRGGRASAAEAGQQRRPPGRPAAGPRGRTSPAASVGTCSPTTTTSAASATARARAPAACGRRTRRRPCRRRPAGRRCRRPGSPRRTALPGSSPAVFRHDRGHVAGWTRGARCCRPAGRRARARRRTGPCSRSSPPTTTDLVVFPEAFARDFGEAGSDVSAFAEPLDGPFVTEVERVGEGAWHDRGGRHVRDQRRSRAARSTPWSPAVRRRRTTARSTSTTRSATASPTGSAPATIATGVTSSRRAHASA